MFPRILLSGLLACLLSPARLLPADEAGRVHVADDLTTNTLKNYQVEGDVTWQKGQVQLGPGAKLTREVKLGHTAEVRAVVRLPGGEDEHGLFLQLHRKEGGAEVALLAKGGKFSLVNLSEPREEIPLAPPAKESRPAELSWILRFRLHYGVAQAKAWPLNATEPADWMTTRYSSGTYWEPIAVTATAGEKHDIFLVRLEIAGTPATGPLPAETESKARECLALDREAAGLYGQGKYREALAKGRESLRLAQEAYGPEHPNTALALQNVGLYLHGMGQLAAARPRLEEALAIQQRRLGLDHPDTALAFHNLGGLLIGLGEYAAGRRHYEQALAINRKLYGPEHPQIALSLTGLGTALASIGEHLAARQAFEQALAIGRRKLGKEHFITAGSLGNLGSLLMDTGDYGTARTYLEQALALHQQVWGVDHPHTVLILEQLGVLLQRMDDCAAARTYVEQALGVQLKSLGPEHVETALTRVNLGFLLARMGEHGAAHAHLDQALAVIEKVHGREHHHTAAALMGLGELMAQKRDHGAAVRHFEEALAIRRKVLGSEHPAIAVSLGNLAVQYRAMGDAARARSLSEQALAIVQKKLGPDHPNAARCLTNLGTLLAADNDHGGVWRHYIGGMQTYGRFAFPLLTTSAEGEHARILRPWRTSLAFVLSLAEYAPGVARGSPSEVLAAALDWKGVSGRTLLSRQEALVVGQDARAAELYADLKAVRHRLVQNLVRGPEREPVEKYREIVDRLRARQDELERKVGERVRDYQALRHAHYAGPADLAQRLGPGTVLIELVKYHHYDFRTKDLQKPWGPARYAAVLLAVPGAQPGKPFVRLVHLGEAKPIDEAVHAWRAAVTRGPVVPDIERHLRERVWEPLARALPEPTERLRIATDGELALLPFEAIRLDDGRYLIERFQVSYVASGRDLMPRPVPPGAPGPALILADPDYGAIPERRRGPAEQPRAGTPTQADAQRRSGDLTKQWHPFERLPGFAREARAIETRLRAADWPVELRQGGAAEEEALAATTRPRLVHLVTHGFFLPDLELPPGNPGERGLGLVSAGPGELRWPAFREDPRLRSGLALAGANRWKERTERGVSDGLLTALEVQNLDLWGTELVVLSACETGLGQVHVGEGVLGLRRAFQQAGAKTVVASLWKIPDAETEKLMTGFLKKWLAGTPKAAALRAAQVELLAELRRDPDPKRKSAPPLYWAGSICHGLPE